MVDALTRFSDEFSCYLADVQKIYRKAYICGDININLFKINENNNYNTFYESVTSSGFMPQITLRTHLSDTCDTLIGIIFTNNFILTRIITDHKMTCCILPNHNAVKRVNREYIEVENIYEKKPLGQLKNELQIQIYMKI